MKYQMLDADAKVLFESDDFDDIYQFVQASHGKRMLYRGFSDREIGILKTIADKIRAESRTP